MKRYLNIGDRVTMTLPYSEVCMHMNVAGKRMVVEIVGPWAAQLWAEDGRPFSAPVTTGEAGVRRDDHGLYVTEDEDVAALVERGWDRDSAEHHLDGLRGDYDEP